MRQRISPDDALDALTRAQQENIAKAQAAAAAKACGEAMEQSPPLPEWQPPVDTPVQSGPDPERDRIAAEAMQHQADEAAERHALLPIAFRFSEEKALIRAIAEFALSVESDDPQTAKTLFGLARALRKVRDDESPTSERAFTMQHGDNVHELRRLARCAMRLRLPVPPKAGE